MVDSDNKLYAHCCDMYRDCVDFLEAFNSFCTYEDFCKFICANCKDCLWLDIPYEGERQDERV